MLPALTKTPGFIGNLMRGMTNQSAGLRDVSFVEAIRDHLFEINGKNNGGLDLVALSIQVIQNINILFYLSVYKYFVSRGDETTV